MAPPRLTDPSRLELRKRFGAWIAEQRRNADLVQIDVSRALSYDYVGTISQIERGFTGLPLHDIKRWAELLRVKPVEMGRQYLYFCEPYLYEMIYGDDPWKLEGLERPEDSITSVTEVKRVLAPNARAKAAPKTAPLPWSDEATAAPKKPAKKTKPKA